MTLDHLKNIAARVKEIGGEDRFSRVSLGTDNHAGVEALHTLGAPIEFTTWDARGHRPAPYTIVHAELRVDGVQFESQYSRDATEEEIAALTSTQAKRMVEDRAYVSPVTP